MITVRPMQPGDASIWLELRCALWPEDSPGAHSAEVARFFAGELREPLAVLLADRGGRAVGFIELSIRPFAEGCVTDRVAYVEGWYVLPEARRQGVGGALIRAAEEWGRVQGCLELASDTDVDNHISTTAHRALGFSEVGVIRCFRKDLAT